MPPIKSLLISKRINFQFHCHSGYDSNPQFPGPWNGEYFNYTKPISCHLLRTIVKTTWMTVAAFENRQPEASWGSKTCRKDILLPIKSQLSSRDREYISFSMNMPRRTLTSWWFMDTNSLGADSSQSDKFYYLQWITIEPRGTEDWRNGWLRWDRKWMT